MWTLVCHLHCDNGVNYSLAYIALSVYTFLFFYRGKEMPSLLRRISQMYQQEGLRSFYRGLSASYFGVTETALYFVLYERFKLYASDSGMTLGKLAF